MRHLDRHLVYTYHISIACIGAGNLPGGTGQTSNAVTFVKRWWEIKHPVASHGNGFGVLENTKASECTSKQPTATEWPYQKSHFPVVLLKGFRPTPCTSVRWQPDSKLLGF